MPPYDSPEFFQNILNATHAGIVYVFDIAQQRNVFINERWMEEFGYSIEETQGSEGRFLASIVHPDDLGAVLAHHEKLANDASTDAVEIEYRVRRKDGGFAWLSSRDRAFAHSADGRVTQILGFAHDITRQKEAEAERRASDLRFRAIVQHLPDAVFIAGPEGEVLEVNEAACRQLGYTRSQRVEHEETLLRESALLEAIINNAVEGICVCEDIPDPPGIFFTVWNKKMVELSGYTKDEINQLGWHQTVYTDDETRARAVDRMDRMRLGENLVAEEWVITRKDGKKRTLLISTSVILDLGDKPKVLGVMHDITDRLRLERQLQDAQRLEAVGRLAGAVAHDFNNVLAAILGGASVLREDGSVPETHRDLLDDIVNSAKRGADLTKQLLTISRRQRTEMKALDLSQLAEMTLRLVARLLSTSVKLEASLTPKCFVWGDHGMLDQVLMNLALNARDAMPGGGTLRVSLAPTEAGAVELTVTDTGEGIEETALPHIFEPFFTTKVVGHGTGLGLATVYGIVAQHGGTVSVQSTVGKGSSFVVSLPTSREPPQAADETRPSAAPQARTLKILLVEDQPLVQRTVTQMLCRRGHNVVTASTAKEARWLWSQHRDDLSLLLTDVALDSGNSGTTLAEEFKAQKPELAVVFMSGFDAALSTLPLMQGQDFLQKPFAASELYQLLERRFP